MTGQTTRTHDTQSVDISSAASATRDARAARNMWNFYAMLDTYRRWRGVMLDAVGTGYQETPFRVAMEQPEMVLRAYDTNTDVTTTTAEQQPVLLIVPAPIKSALIWDLAPDISVVQRCRQWGIRVYMVQWKQPGNNGGSYGLAEYADRFLRNCIETITAETGAPQVFLTGHSSGGIFAAIFAALHPKLVRGLILAGTPLHFGADTGTVSQRVAQSPDVRQVTAQVDTVPGSFLNRESVGADRWTFGGSRWLDWANSLGNYDAMMTHLRVRRWTLDEMPMAGQLFEEVIEWLYRENRFLQGTLQIGEQCAAPQNIVAPVVSIIDKRCTIVPPESVLPFHAAVQSEDTTVLWYPGDIGVALQHVGFLVGHTAHQHIWPLVIRWMHDH